ncbi:MAG: RNA polymerase sigma factor RpoD/SigA [Chloroflexota bacterium]|nr:RNA polymerase sigma factor RpoD/SigA [Chloroflexota bacterium]
MEDPAALLSAEILAATADTLVDYGIEEIDEDFGYTVELDPALTAQLERMDQCRNTRSVYWLAAHLVAAYKQHGGITYRELIFALRTANRDVEALTQLCALLVAADVRVKRAPHLYRFSRMSPADRTLIETVFHPILSRQIAPAIAIQRLGYADVRLSQANRALLVDALERHQLSRAEERAVFADIERAGGPATEAARPLVHQIINDNLWVVAKVARRYVGRGLAFADLFQEGVLGLYRAVNGFDLALGLRFMIYAHSWVWQGITRALSDKARLIRLPVHVNETLIALERITLRLEQDRQRAPTIAEIGAALHMGEPQIRRLQVVAQAPLSLEAVCAREGVDLFRYLADPDPSIDPEAVALHQDLSAVLTTALGQLPERERQIIRLRYGLGDDRARTLEEVGTAMGVTRERIRQIETKVLRKLGNSRLNHDRLHQYLNDDPPVNLPVADTLPRRRHSANGNAVTETTATEQWAPDSAPLMSDTDERLLPAIEDVEVSIGPIDTVVDPLYSVETYSLPSVHEDAPIWQSAFLVADDGSTLTNLILMPPKRGRGRPRKNSH